MTDAELLTILKSNLDKLNSDEDTYLAMLISVAKKEIAREGVTLSLDELDHCNLVVMYAAYLFRYRASDKPVMPRMLRYELNNVLMEQKARASG